MCSCDIAEMPDFCDEKTPKARKEHKCCECGFPIEIGEKYVAVSGKWGGDMRTYRRHEDCHTAAHMERGCVSAFGCVQEDIWECCQKKPYENRDGSFGPAIKLTDEQKQARSAWARTQWRFRHYSKRLINGDSEGEK